jgi:hypothetical protein
MLFRCDDFWLSPVFDTLSQVALRVGAPRDPVTDSGPTTRSASCLLAALLMALVSVLLAGAWSVRRRFSPRKQSVWLMASALLGLPGLIGLVLVDPAARAAATD